MTKKAFFVRWKFVDESYLTFVGQEEPVEFNAKSVTSVDYPSDRATRSISPFTT
jgi:hypothetical protein